MRRFTEADNGQRAQIAAGESFEMSLPENPATGFHWKVISGGEPVCSLTNDRFEPASGVGGQGIHHWRFRAREPGTGEIHFALQRSWESPVASGRSVTLKFRVTPA